MGFSKKKAIPLASLAVKSNVLSEVEVIPTLFITNRTFLHIEEKAITALVDNIFKKLTTQIKAFPNHLIQTIQIDCDWSLRTKDKYFLFLKKLKKQLHQKDISLSATIRLHQVKFFKKTGIPPVSRGLLMFYNMGEVTNFDTNNSILDLDVAQKYIAFIPHYPLPLDLGLPLFQWGVLFRNGKMIQLINQLKASELSDKQYFEQLPNSNKWKVLKSTYHNGLYLYEGDIIRIEKVSEQALQASIELLRPYFQGKTFDLIFYHLEEEVLSSFSTGTISQLVQQF